MGLAKLRTKITVDEYLEGEKISPVRHEYFDGEVYAVAGTSKTHNRISRKLLRRLEGHLDGSDCEPFYNEVKVRIKSLNRFYYPDLIVVCGADAESEYYVTRPTIIVEVLSPSTALTDKREKWFAYQEIESLREYVMIEQESQRVEVYRKRDDSLWSHIEFTADEHLELTSIDFKMPLIELYT